MCWVFFSFNSLAFLFFFLLFLLAFLISSKYVSKMPYLDIYWTYVLKMDTDLIHVHKDYKTYKFTFKKKILIVFENNFRFLLTGDLILSPSFHDRVWMQGFIGALWSADISSKKNPFYIFLLKDFRISILILIFSTHQLTSGCNLNHIFSIYLKCNHKCC